MKFNQPATILAHSLVMSVQDIIDKYTSDEVQEGNQMLNSDGDIFIPLNIAPSVPDDALPKFPRVPNDTKVSWESLRRACKNDITTIEYNIDAIDIGVFLQQLAQNEGVYGCLLTTEDGFNINPLHPLIAFMYNADIIQLPKSGKLHIFEWGGVNYFKNVISEDTLQQKTEEYFNELLKFLNLTPNIIMSQTVLERTVNINESDISSMIEQPYISNLSSVNMSLQTKELSSNGIRPDSLLIPLQKISSGISTPYYGLAYIKGPTEQSRGFNISPMMSGNLNITSETGAGGVCTGSENGSSRNGWLTLSNINLNSMFYSDILWQKSTYPYILACKKFSAEIWAAYSATRNSHQSTEESNED